MKDFERFIQQWNQDHPEEAALNRQLTDALLWELDDYAPWGDVEDRRSDCSCGCRWFVEVRGQAGADWGVCTNPASHRCGLLTFEHQGCHQFEMDETEDRS